MGKWKKDINEGKVEMYNKIREFGLIAISHKINWSEYGEIVVIKCFRLVKNE